MPTQSTQDEQARQQSVYRPEDALRLLEACFAGIWSIDSELRTNFVNARMAEMLGYSPQEMLGRTLYDFLFPEDVSAEQNAIARRRSGVSEQFELRYRRKDGSEFWAQVATAPVLASDGIFLGAVAMHIDIAHRRNTEQTLQQRETELRQAELLAGVGSWKQLPGSNSIVCSEGFYRIAGREPDSLNSDKDHQHLYTPESWTRLNASARAALADGKPYETDLELVRPDGSTRWVVARGEASLDKYDRVVHLLGTIHDITERRTAEQASRKLAAIVESSDDAIISKNLRGIITSWNSAATRIFGYAPDEVIGQSILTLIPPELHAEEDFILKRLRAGERIEHYETERLTKDGRRLPMSLTISPIRDAGGQVIGASKIARDISERKRAEQALLTSEKLATAGRLAATVAHEINNPLEAALNLVYLARKTAADSAVQAYLSTAEEELNRVAQMARETLSFYRERSERTPVQAGELLRQVVAVFSSKAQNKRLQIILESVGDAEIMVDRTEIRRLFSNLISNSIDACETGGTVRVRASVTKGPSALACGLRVTVADNGSGIKPDDRLHLFEPFFTTKKDIGTGIGLWVCKQITEKYNGSIHVHSDARPGRSWTAVSVFLPVTVSSGNFGKLKSVA